MSSTLINDTNTNNNIEDNDNDNNNDNIDNTEDNTDNNQKFYNRHLKHYVENYHDPVMFVLIILIFAVCMYLENSIIYFFAVFGLLLILGWVCIYYKWWLGLAFISIILIFLIPNLYFYADLGYNIFPFMNYKRNKCKEMKEMCSKFLDKHFTFKVNKVPSIVNNTPVIFLVNHHDRRSRLIDMLCTLKIPGNNKIVLVNKWDSTSTLYSNLYHIALPKSKKGNTDYFLKQAQKTIKEGYNLIIFPEGRKFTDSKESWRKIDGLQSGSFILSKQLNIPVIPVLISGDCFNSGFIMDYRIKMKYLDPIYPNNYNSVDEYRESVKNIMNNGLKSLY